MSLSIYLFLLVLIPHVASINFNLTKMGPKNLNTDILTDGNISISNVGIKLLTDGKTGRTARASYLNLLHLWDKPSNELASFSTEFSFAIRSKNKSEFYGDGFTFFLAENNSLLGGSGCLGLPIDCKNISVINPFVAVEFDTFKNDDWDPADYHVGIDVKSIISSKSKKWPINITSKGTFCKARIEYNSSLKNLGVVTYNTWGSVELNYNIDLRHVLPEKVIFGFSAATGNAPEEITIISWNFTSSNLAGDEGQAQAPASRMEAVNQMKKKIWAGRLAGIIAGSIFLIAFLAIVAFCLCRRKKNKREQVEQTGYDGEMNEDFEMGTGPRRFSYRELVKATAGFLETNKLGEGGFGEVYKGFLKDLGTYIAVKRVSKTYEQGIKEYASEVKIISRLRHKNLLELKGWCHEKRELLLVYEFMENGSLDLHLFKGKSLLTWDKRYRIAHGLASALLYLHGDCKECVLHRDIKSSNVMLDSNFNAKLGDFGLAKLVDNEKGSRTTILAGTMGYMAPEYLMTGKATKASDVFSFGIVALEIACGKPIFSNASESKSELVEWVWDLYGTATLLEAADPGLASDFVEEEIKSLMIVGLWCANPDPDSRPSMKQIIQVLNFEAILPILPSKMPKVTYYVPSTSSSSYVGISGGCDTAPSNVTSS